MGEPTMEEYMTKTREDYGSGIARPKFNENARFELKGHFLKELHDNIFSGSDNEDANEHIERFLEIADLFTIPDVTQDQLMLRIFPISLTRAASRWIRNEPAGSITTWEILKGNFFSKYCPPGRTAKKMEEINNFQQEPNETLYHAWERFKKLLVRCPQHYLTNMQEVILFYKGLDVFTRQILDSKGVVPMMNAANAKKAIQKMADHSKKWHNETSTRCRGSDTSDGLAVIQAQLNNLGREIKKVNEKVYAAQGSGSLPSLTETNPRDHVKSISTCEETETPSIWHIRSHRYGVSNQLKGDIMSLMELNQAIIPLPGHLRKYGYDMEEIKATMNSHCSTILEDALPPKEKDLGSFTLPCYINNMSFNKALADLGASVSVMPYSTFTNLGLDELAPTKLIIELADRTVKRLKGIAKNVLIVIDKFVFPVDFIVLDMPKDIKVPLILRRPFLSTAHAKIDVFKRSQDPKFGDFLELNGLNEPCELMRNQEVDNLGPTAEEGEVIDKPMKDIVNTRYDDKNIEGIDEYLSVFYYDRKIHIKCAYNL
ncbi:hypothetical protein Tco_1208079 [Tanacetum coccineum]